MDLIEAISALDADNDEHWTANGLPRIDALKEMTGEDDITRMMIDELAPDYTRTSRYDLYDDDDDIADSVPDEVVAEPAPVVSASEVESAIAKRTARIEVLEEEIDTLGREVEVLQREIAEKRAALEVEQFHLMALRPKVTHSAAVQDYQRSSSASRRALADSAAAITQGLGVNAGRMIGMSQLDIAMAARRSARNRRRSPTRLAGQDR